MAKGRAAMALLVVWSMCVTLIAGVDSRGEAQGFSRKAAKTQSSDAGERSTTFTASAFSSNSDDNLLPPGITHTFSNSAPINLPVGGSTSVYPSSIDVSNIPTQLAKVTVTLHSINHGFPSDLDVLLVGPQGQTAVVMSDCGGADDLENVTITLDDEAGSEIPLFQIPGSGTYKPTNLTGGGEDIFPPPAPASPGINQVLGVFSGSNPNGQWRLFVIDDVGFVDGGSILGGWSITFTSAFSGQNTGAITIPSAGQASPYPSEIEITNHVQPISSVVVRLINFSHSSPDDVDVLLVSPSGRSVVLMSDVGGSNSVNNLNITFDDNAFPSMPDSGSLSSGTFRPTDFEPGDSFPAPAPATAPQGRLLSSLHGTTSDGIWRLFVVDDAGNNVGAVTGGWNVLLGVDGGAVNIQGGAIASPYPSEISFAGLPGNISNVKVHVRGFSHTAPDDVDIMLVGPDGRKAILMSDAGGSAEVGGLSLNFDDQAQGTLPDGAPLESGTFKPTNYEPGDTFPAPAPAGTPASSLQTFFGGVPNGIWKLYIVGDGAASYGSLGTSWGLTLTTSTSACLFTISSTVQAFPVAGGSGGFTITQPDGCSWAASTTDSFLHITGGSSGAGNGAVTFTVDANQGPARTGIIEVSNGSTVRNFQVQQASGCPTSVSQSTVAVSAAGGPRSINVTAGSPCSWQGITFASWIQVTSPPQTGSGTLQFNVQPNTTGVARSGHIDVGAMSITVNQAPQRSTLYDFDGDARSDISVFRPSTGAWWISRSSDGGASAQQFGLAQDRITPADYDGDQKTDIAVYRDGTWYVLRSSDGGVTISQWGINSDIPIPADYTGDGRAEQAVYRPSTGTWWILRSDGTFISTPFGIPSDIPTPADYDGDSKADISVYRSATAAGQQGTWWIMNSSDASVRSVQFGIQGDAPVTADYDGDGLSNIAVYRPSTGFWYRSTNPATNYDGVQLGIPGDVPAPGDFDGDGRTDAAVFRPSNGTWYILRSTSGTLIQQFGTTGDVAVPR